MSECYCCKNHHENFQNENPVNNKKRKSLGSEPNKKKVYTKGKVNVNGFEVIQTKKIGC